MNYSELKEGNAKVERNLEILNAFYERLKMESRLRVDNHANTKEGLVDLTLEQAQEIASGIKLAIANGDSFQLYLNWSICEQLCRDCPYVKVLLSDLKEIRGENATLELARAISNQIMAHSSFFEGKKAGIIYNGGGTASLRSHEESESIYAALQMIVDLLPTKEINLEGSGSHFTPEKIVEEIELRKRYFPNAMIRWSAGGFGENISGRVEPVDSCLEAIPRINELCKSGSVPFIINVDFVFGNKNFDNNKTIQNILDTLDKMLNSGIGENGILGQITTYGMRNSLGQEAHLETYLKEYFEIDSSVHDWLRIKNLELSDDNQLVIEYGPQTLGGRWLTIKKKNILDSTEFYIQNRWSMFNKDGELSKEVLQGLGNAAYSAFPIFEDSDPNENIRFVRPTVKPNIDKYIENSSSISPTAEGLMEYYDVRILNINYKTAQELHSSCRYYFEFTTGQNMIKVNEYLLVHFLQLIKTDIFGHRYLDFSSNDFVALREGLMSYLNQNSAFYPKEKEALSL